MEKMVASSRSVSKKMNVLKERLKESHLQNLKDPYSWILDVIGTEIKEDRRTSSFIFLTGISAYGPDPLNCGLQAPTSEGKTHPVVKVLKHFPKEDVWFIGKLSPMALVHQHGELVDEEGKRIEPKLESLHAQIESGKDRVKKRQLQAEVRDLNQQARYRVNLANKILVFLEEPHPETWNMLKPILSHDVWNFEYRIVQQNRSGRHETKLTLLSGWPAAIFCSSKDAKDAYWPEISSRFITISPNMSPQKYRSAIRLDCDIAGLPGVAVSRLTCQESHATLSNYILHVREYLKSRLGSVPTENPSIVWNPYRTIIGEHFPANTGRHMRDAKRFIGIMNASTLSLPFHRPKLKIGDKEYLIVVKEDYERALSLYLDQSTIATLFTGVPSNVLDFFEKVVVPLCGPDGYATTSAMVEEQRKEYGRSLSSDTIRTRYLSVLEQAGYVDREPDPTDRRQHRWRIIVDLQKLRESPLLSGSSDFAFDDFKKDYSKLEQLTASAPQIVGVEDDDRTLEELWNSYFVDSPGQAVIVPSSNSDDSEQERGNEVDSCKFDELLHQPEGQKQVREIEPKTEAVTYPTRPPEATDNCAVPPTPTRRRRKPLELEAVLPASLSKS
jgi:hypothetical protein